MAERGVIQEGQKEREQGDLQGKSHDEDSVDTEHNPQLAEAIAQFMQARMERERLIKECIEAQQRKRGTCRGEVRIPLPASVRMGAAVT